jgi:hypothetical protein
MRAIRRCADRIRRGHLGRRLRRYGVERIGRRFAVMRLAVIMIVMRMIVVMMVFVAVMALIAQRLFIAMGVNVAFAMLMMVMLMVVMFVRLPDMAQFLARIGACSLDHGALHAVAAAAARIAMARTAAAAGTVFGFFLGFAMSALVGLDQRLAIGNRNLIIVRVDFAESQEAVAVAAIFDEGGLQRRLYARDLGEIDIAAQLLALGGLEVKLFDAIAADHDDPGLFWVGGIDQHFVGHFGTHDGGGRVSRCARVARPGDATVHLIRG